MQNWYDQAGTPTVNVSMEYDQEAKTCTLHFTQVYIDTPETTAEQKKPYLIPIKLGLLSKDSGNELLNETVKLTDKVHTILIHLIVGKRVNV